MQFVSISHSGAYLIILAILQATSLASSRQESSEQWNWSLDRSNVAGCVAYALDDFDVEITCPKGRTPVTILITRESKKVLCLQGHAYTVLARLGDVLYFADYLPYVPGCTIRAYDLRDGKERWSTGLRAAGIPEWISRYSNRVDMTIEGGVITIRGSETNGRYIEKLDPETGARLSHIHKAN